MYICRNGDWELGIAILGQEEGAGWLWREEWGSIMGYVVQQVA